MSICDKDCCKADEASKEAATRRQVADAFLDIFNPIAGAMLKWVSDDAARAKAIDAASHATLEIFFSGRR